MKVDLEPSSSDASEDRCKIQGGAGPGGSDPAPENSCGADPGEKFSGADHGSDQVDESPPKENSGSAPKDEIPPKKEGPNKKEAKAQGPLRSFRGSVADPYVSHLKSKDPTSYYAKGQGWVDMDDEPPSKAARGSSGADPDDQPSVDHDHEHDGGADPNKDSEADASDGSGAAHSAGSGAQDDEEEESGPAPTEEELRTRMIRNPPRAERGVPLPQMGSQTVVLHGWPLGRARYAVGWCNDFLERYHAEGTTVIFRGRGAPNRHQVTIKGPTSMACYEELRLQTLHQGGGPHPGRP